MTNGYGDQNGQQYSGSESRQGDGGIATDNARPNGFSDEQAMLGLSSNVCAENSSEHLFVHDDFITAYPLHVIEKPLPEIRVTVGQHWQKLIEIVTDALLYEYERGTVFLLIACVTGGGAVHYFALPSEPYWLQLTIPAVLISCLLLLLRDTLIRRVILTLVLAFITGMAAAKWETQRHATPMLGSSVSFVLTARIVSMDQEAPTNGKAGRWRVVADVLATEKPQLRYAPRRLKLSARDLPALAETGALIKGAVRVRPHGGPVRSGQYDFAFHGFFRDIGGNGFFLGTPKMAEKLTAFPDDNAGWGADIRAIIARMRALIGGRIMQALPGEEGAVAAALISGQRAGISEPTNEALRRAGLAHILSISGLHLAMAAGIVMFSARGFAGLFPSLSLYYPVKKIAALISLFSSGFYLAVSGGDVAAQRSFIMLAVMLCAVMFDRQALTMRNLAIAALFSIMLTPHEILGPSFQMSYSATGALIAAFAWWKWRAKLAGNKTRKQGGILFRLRQAVVGTLATSLVAGTASGLFAAFHFNNVAPLGMLGNVLALPVISVLIMPFAVMGLLLMPLGLEWLPLQVMGKGIELVKWVAHFVADLSPDLIPGLLPAPVLLLWTISMLLLMILTSQARWLAVVFLGAGGMALVASVVPDVIISEDARLVAVRQKNALFVNRARAAGFTISNWKKAYSITEVKIPATTTTTTMTTDQMGFSCGEGLCSYDFEDGRILAYAETPVAGQAACLIADIVILAYAGDISCAQLHDNKPSTIDNQLVISRQQLALKGVAEIYLAPSQDVVTPHKTVFALGAPERPWHLYRLYSRPARNLADWK